MGCSISAPLVRAQKRSRPLDVLHLTIGLIGAVIFSASGAPAEQPQYLHDLNKALMEAAKKGDLKAAKSALEKGADPNARVFEVEPIIPNLIDSSGRAM
jgi:hypothetical protein